MATLAKGAAIALSVLTVATAGVVLALPGHAGLTGASAAGSTPSASASASPAAQGGGSQSPGAGGTSATASQPGGTGAAASGGSASGGSAGGSAGGPGASGSAGGGSAGGSASGGSAQGGTSGGQGGAQAGGSSGGSGVAVHPIFAPGVLHLITIATLPSPSGTIGDPGVPCLQGYVWREAFKGDYVCVTPGVRTQAAADNAVASSRIAAGGGAYGRYTCVQGYVWRQVVPDDYVCVTPGVRSQAAADNAQAGNRVALLRLWLTDWNPPSQSQQNCSGNVCSTTQGGWNGPDFQLNGDHFNRGPVLLQIRRNNGSVLWSDTVQGGNWPGFAGGAFGTRTPIGDCRSVPGTTSNDYAIAYDTVSGRWSSKVPVNSDCGSL